MMMVILLYLMLFDFYRAELAEWRRILADAVLYPEEKKEGVNTEKKRKKVSEFCRAIWEEGIYIKINVLIPLKIRGVLFSQRQLLRPSPLNLQDKKTCIWEDRRSSQLIIPHSGSSDIIATRIMVSIMIWERTKEKKRIHMDSTMACSVEENGNYLSAIGEHFWTLKLLTLLIIPNSIIVVDILLQTTLAATSALKLASISRIPYAMIIICDDTRHLSAPKNYTCVLDNDRGYSRRSDRLCPSPDWIKVTLDIVRIPQVES